MKALIVPLVGQPLHAPGEFEAASEAGDDVAISLPVKFNLAGFILHELGLVAALDGAEFVGAAAGEEKTGEGKRKQTDQEQNSQNDIEETDASELFEHSWNQAVTIAAGVFAAEVVGLIGLPGDVHPASRTPLLSTKCLCVNEVCHGLTL